MLYSGKPFRCILFLCLCFFISLPSYSEPTPYLYGSLGLGVQSGESPGSDSFSVLSNQVRLGVGKEYFRFLSLQVGIAFWHDPFDDEDEEEDERDDRVRFGGIALTWDALVKIPLESGGGSVSSGPYLRYGRHCWGASVSGLDEPLSVNGCSQTLAGGLFIPFVQDAGALGVANDASQTALYVEFSSTQFDDISSGTLSAGIQAAF